MIAFDDPDDFPRVLANPRMPAEAVAPLQGFLASEERWRGLIAVASSGTTGSVPGRNKWVLLSRTAILTSAHGVNRWFQSDASDVWAQPLPEFHVGGLGILARAFLSGARVVRLPEWNPEKFAQAVHEEKATLSSLVPAQLFDLVGHGLRGSESLRGIVIGGGALDEDLRRQAWDLGWPVLPSYGLSECASQVATARDRDGELGVLPHVEIDVSAEGRLRLRSEALLTGYVFVENGACTFVDPKVDGAFLSEDLGEVAQGKLHLRGRVDDRIKVGGENVDLARLDRLLAGLARDWGFAPGEIALVPVDDARLGKTVQLAAKRARAADALALIDQFNNRVLPFERIRACREVETIPLSALGKILRGELARLLSGN